MADEKTIDEGTTQEVATEQVAEQQTEQQEENAIPPELEGIDDEEIVKEVMAEAKGVPVEEVEKPAPQTDKVTPSQQIPYPRFKEVIDEGKKKDAEIAELKKQLEAFRQAPPQPQYQPQAQTPQPAPQPQQFQQNTGVQLTPENVKLIDDAVNREAQAMAQLSKEDMDSLEYMEDDDPRKVRWQYAKEIARGNIFDRIRQAQAIKAEQARRFMEAHQKSVAEFNAYANQVTQEADFEQVKNYAVNDFFKALPSEQDKQVIAAAYARIERQSASPEDIYLIKNFYQQARAAYHNQHPATTSKQTNRTEQASKFPRSNQVSGTGDAGGGVTVASLEKMLNEMPFDDIDPKYQKILLGE
jgi:hypothetical protein